MPAVLHITALVFSSVCLCLSLRAIRGGRWRDAGLDALMVTFMTWAIVFPNGAGSLIGGALLIALALIAAAGMRRRRNKPERLHRALCLLVMGATTIVMSSHTNTLSGLHDHAPSLQLVGVIGVIVTIAIAIRLGRRWTPASTGMLVATALMSVATCAA